MSTEFILSMRKTKSWSGYATFSGSLVKIFLPKLWKGFFWFAKELGLDKEDPLDLWLSWSCDFLSWSLVHEYVHAQGVRHTQTWTSYQGLI